MKVQTITLPLSPSFWDVYYVIYYTNRITAIYKISEEKISTVKNFAEDITDDFCTQNHDIPRIHGSDAIFVIDSKNNMHKLCEFAFITGEYGFESCTKNIENLQIPWDEREEIKELLEETLSHLRKVYKV